jgi:lanthanide-dependent methanol dehydrogenase
MKKIFLAALMLFSSTALGQDLTTLQNDDKQWVMPSKDYAQTRFSRLTQINTGNAGKLQPAWTFSVGSNHGQEAAPIVVGETMYVVGAYPNELFALDSVTGDLKWKYSPHVDPSAQGEACCDVVNRGAVFADGSLSRIRSSVRGIPDRGGRFFSGFCGGWVSREPRANEKLT